MAIKVTLRKKKITNAKRYSLYLDFYPPINIGSSNETRREFLKMYLIANPKTEIEKQQNKETLSIANNICQKRLNELNKPEIYTAFEKELLRKKETGKKDFIVYFKMLASKRNKSSSDSWSAALAYLFAFSNGEIKFSDLNYRLLEDFKHYLLNANSRRSDKSKLSQNSASSYFNKVKTALREAYTDGFLQKDLNRQVRSIKVLETRIEFLTLEELNLLSKTDCKSKVFKRMAIFSALTGLRFSDIKNLKWFHIEFIKNRGYFVNYNQQKTKSVEVHPISEYAYKLLEEPQESSKLIFTGLQSTLTQSKHLKHWLSLAGISKKITFHCFRHTYATLQLSEGASLYTVSSLLGHKNIQTTQIYAKVVDADKRKAANSIKLDL